MKPPGVWNLGRDPQVAWVPSLPDDRSGQATSGTLPHYPARQIGLDPSLDAVIDTLQSWHLDAMARGMSFDSWYRQSARLWHPDKNPDKVETATAVIKWLNDFKELQST